jgi:NADH-quinone oxidoreductase subunit L
MTTILGLGLVFGPLIGALKAGFWHFCALSHPDRKPLYTTLSVFVTILFMGLSTICALLLATTVFRVPDPIYITIAPWIERLSVTAYWALQLDRLSIVMALVVTSISTLVHVYSASYMIHDKGLCRFMSYLSLFTFCMLMLITAENLLQLFFGWEGVGLCSYLLIGYWHHKPSAYKAAIKAFVVNRVGDLGLILGLAAVVFLTRSVSFAHIFPLLEAYTDQAVYGLPVLTYVCIFLLIGAMGKSAQFGLHTWLPDAMEGPTPVSALIHAATMVTAGVFLICRFSPLFHITPYISDIILIVGTLTAIFAATVACAQTDIKKIIAYSTCSQLGFMFMALGASAYGAALFHLMTHAFFKALLFLGAGSVAHALSNEQDIRRMGGLWKKIPYTYFFMLIGALALAGFPLMAGYYSKDVILEAVWLSSPLCYAIGLLSALLTAFYSGRLIIVVFWGQSRTDDNTAARIHESPYAMLLPLALLAIGSVMAGFWGYKWFVGPNYKTFWAGTVVGHDLTLKGLHHCPWWVPILPMASCGLGLLLSGFFYIKRTTWAKNRGFVHQFFYNAWYIDKLYLFVFVTLFSKMCTTLWHWIDQKIIDRLGPTLAGRLSWAIGGSVNRFHKGTLYQYGLLMLISAIVIVGWLLICGQLNFQTLSAYLTVGKTS